MLSTGLTRQVGSGQTPGLSEVVLVPFSSFSYTAGSAAGTIATVTASSATVGFRFVLPDNLGNYAIAFNGRTKEHAITLNFNSESLNPTVWAAFNGAETSGPMIAFARGKKQGSDNAWRILGRNRGLIVTAGTEDSATSGTAPTNLLTFSGIEPTKPEWIELTAEEDLTGAFAQITISAT